MKKFLLSIFAVMLAVFSVQAEETVTFNFKNLYGSSTLQSIESKTVDGITVSYDKNSAQNAPGFNKDGTMRLYYAASGDGCSATFTTDGTKKITKVVITATTTPNVKYSVDGGATATGTWSSKTMTISNIQATKTFAIQNANTSNTQLRISSIVLTCEKIGGGETPEAPAAPTLPEATSFTDDEFVVEITNNADNAIVYYSLNNENDWVEGSTVTIDETTTIYAKAVDADDETNESQVVSATYTKIEPKTIAEVIADGAVDQAMTSGTVVATYSRGFLLGDGTGYILVYQGASLTTEFSVGDVVAVSGPTNKYNGFLQFQTTAVIEKTGTAEVVYPNVTTLDGEAMDAYLAKSSVQYVEYTGTLSVDTEKGYYNVAIDGAETAVGSISYPKAGIVEAEDGDVVKVTGYTIGVSSSKYVNTMAVSVEVVEGGATDPEEPETPEIPEEPETPGSVTAPCYVKVTSAPADWSGKYLIVYEDGTDAYVFKALESAKNYVAATIDNGVILATEDLNAVAVEIASIQGGYSIETSEGYMYGTSGSNKLSFNGTTAQLNTIEYDSEDGVKITSNTSVFRFNSASDNLRFRYFKSTSYTSQKSVQLYKYTEPVAETWSSFYAAFPVAIPEGVEAYIVTAANAGYVTLTQIYNAVPASTGVILKGGSIEATYDNYYSGAVAEVTGNLLQGTVAATEIDVEAYVLGKVDGVIGLYKAKMTDGVWLNNANKAYLPASVVPAAAQGAASFSFRFGEGTTGVEDVEVENEVKAIYDLAGRRVEAITAPGVYIVGGKKVLVK